MYLVDRQAEGAPEPIQFRVTVRSRAIGWGDVLSWIGSFLGPLLTLPGLIAFINSMRKAKTPAEAPSATT